MFRYLVVADSHASPAYVDRMARRFREEQCEGIIHLGDLVEDAQKLERLTGVQVDMVRGNCDEFAREPVTLELEAEGVRMLLCHGHTFGVKRTLYDLSEAAQKVGAQLALFGHTHQAYVGHVDNVLLMNPGALQGGRYGILELENGVSRPFLKSLVEKR